MKALITGGFGFMGSALARECLFKYDQVIIVDILTYAANTDSVPKHEKLKHHLVDILDRPGLAAIMSQYQPDHVFHLAAESHVDRSIASPFAFFETNVLGTLSVVESFKNYYQALSQTDRTGKVLIHVSTDEVFGETSPKGPSFTEKTPYKPRSPYSASKAGSDHLVSAFRHTYNLPLLITNSCNNYGPWQNEEKLIPKVILSIIQGRAMPVYGDGKQMRQWIFAEDHARALIFLAESHYRSKDFQFMIGGDFLVPNMNLIDMIGEIMEKTPMVEHVEDRPGHDFCYKVDSTRLKGLGWRQEVTFRQGLRRTIDWYLEKASDYR